MDALSAVQRAGSAIGSVTSAASQLLGALGLTKDYLGQVRQASFRGIPFSVLASDGTFGRRNALHEYPFRDDVWVEDLGRQARRINLVGYLIGDDVIDQRDRFIRAAESEDTGELIHPTLGSMTVSLMTAKISEKWDEGRVFQMMLSFVESGLREFPAGETDTGDEVDAAADESMLAIASDYAAKVRDSLVKGLSVVNQVVAVTVGFGLKVRGIINSAHYLYNSISSYPTLLKGTARSLTGAFSMSSGPLPASDVRLAIAAGSVSRRDTGSAVTAVSAAAAAISPAAAGVDAFTASAAAVVTRIRTGASSPADAVIALAALSGFSAELPPTDGSPIGMAMGVAQSQTVALMQRMAVVEMARATAGVQPASFDEALALQQRVSDLLDRHIVAAADAGMGGSYAALRRLRAAVVADMVRKGADLSRLQTVSLNGPVPALVLAQRLYRDPGRSTELVDRVRPVHPAFMPPTLVVAAR